MKTCLKNKNKKKTPISVIIRYNCKLQRVWERDASYINMNLLENEIIKCRHDLPHKINSFLLITYKSLRETCHDFTL